jgi:predicted ATPase
VAPLPSGTVTFLFTDIERSTRLLSELGRDAYAETLAGHRRALRDAFRRHGGVEVDTQGDAFFVAFERASDAVAAAEAAQATNGPRVRIGLHTGEPDLTEDGYVGMDVHVAARIADAGHGGQTLLSERTSALADARVRPLGLHRLKDVPEPVAIYQLGDEPFPPLRTAGQVHLPQPPPGVVGRKRELADLLRLVRRDGARLLTVTGPGGVGKTRFAVEAAWNLSADFDDGAWFVDLSAIREPALVLPAIGAAIGADNGPANHIGDRRVLVVLDNLEQVAAAAPEITGLLAGCPRLVLLGTSREPLRTTAEREYPLRPLAEAPAVELFRQRAEAARPDFAASYDELAQICARLDNLPLTIELAAARIRLLSPQELAARLSERLPLLTSGARDAPERQRTLRAAIAWSYDFLTPAEQALFGRLSVFVGGFTLEAAEEVADADLNTLASLVEKSLVRRDDDRFSMLETIREFALEQLGDTREYDDVSRRHAEFFLALGDEADDALAASPAQRGLIDRARPEGDNCRAAVRWALGSKTPELGLRLAACAYVFQIGPGEIARWLDRALPFADRLEPHRRALVLNEACGTNVVIGRYEQAHQLAERSVSLAREVGDERLLALTVRHLGNAAAGLGSFAEADASFRESIELSERLGDSVIEYRALHGLGELQRDHVDPNRARPLLRKATALARKHGDLSTATAAMHGLADAELLVGELEAAESGYREALSIGHELSFSRILVYCTGGLAAVAAASGDAERAGRLWGAVETLERERGFPLVEPERPRYETLLARVDQAVFAEATERGRRMTFDEAIEYALADA